MSFKIFVVVIPKEGLAGEDYKSVVSANLWGPTHQSFWYNNDKDIFLRHTVVPQFTLNVPPNFNYHVITFPEC